MISLRWLGVAGLELTYNDQVLLIDPYLTRFPFWQQWIGTVQSNQAVVRAILPRADFVLVTHAHYDHLLDVPTVLDQTSARGLGSANTIQLLKILGIPTQQLQQLSAGDELILGEFRVKVILSHHQWVPIFGPGNLLPGLHPPLRARDYRMDTCFSYLITVSGLRILVNSGEFQEDAPLADILFANPMYTHTREKFFLQNVQPRLVIPIHWDDFWQPLNKPVHPIYQPPSRKTSFRIKPVNLILFQKDITQILPGTKILVPDRLHTYDLQNL
jgi:L-ascorbate metabolism protein UlaG (beta-lactamase superfamily)